MASYQFACSGYTIPIATSNTLAGSGFFTAANPSSANGGIGSSVVLNWGNGTVVLAPAMTGSGVGVLSYGSGVPMPGTAIVYNPATGQTLSSYSFVLPTTDPTTNIMTIGGLSINATTATVPNVQATTMNASNLYLSNTSGVYLAANGVSIAIGVPMTVSGILSDMIIYGTASATKFLVEFSNSSVLLSANTASGAITLGTDATNLNAVTSLYGNLNIGGESYSNKFSVSAAGTPFLALDTNNGIFTVSNTAILLTSSSYTTVSGAASANKLQVLDGSGVQTFNVDTENGPVSVGGADSGTAEYKFAVRNSTLGLVFGVQTNSTTPASEQVLSRSIMPLVTGDALGSSGNPWTIYGTVNPPSDSRLKTRGAELSGAECADFVRSVDLNWFTYLAEQQAGLDRKHVGMMTDNIRAVAPALAEALVTGDKNCEAVSLYSLVTVLAGAIKYLLKQA